MPRARQWLRDGAARIAADLLQLRDRPDSHAVRYDLPEQTIIKLDKAASLASGRWGIAVLVRFPEDDSGQEDDLANRIDRYSCERLKVKPKIYFLPEPSVTAPEVMVFFRSQVREDNTQLEALDDYEPQMRQGRCG